MEEKPDPCSTIQFPPGFRFYPSDEELIVHYLRNKVTSSPVPASIIAEIDLYKFNPWDLPNQALFGEEEWYFFTPRDRKYPNGARTNRAAASGYWKATGTDKPIVTSCGSKRVGVKKALVFYAGRPPKGVKTDWIMNEYRILDAMIWSSKRKGSMRLDDWVLCRVRKKSGNSRNSWDDRKSYNTSNPETFSCLSNQETCPKINASPNLDMIKSSMYQGCPLLPYIFSAQRFPSSPPNISSKQGKLLDFESNNNNNINQGINNLESCFSPATAFSVVVNDGCEEGKPIGDINDSGFFQPYDNNNGEEEVMASAENNLVNMINYGDGSAWAQETIEGSSSSYLAGYEWNTNSSTSTQSQFLELNGMMAFNGTPLQFD